MKRIIIVLSALLLLLIIIYTQINIHKTGTLYSYNGCVSTLDQVPIQNARVKYHFDDIDVEVLTDSNGCYSLHSENEASSATVEKSGYEFYFNGESEYLTYSNPNNFIGWKSVSETVIHGGDINLLLTDNPSEFELKNGVIVEVKSDDKSDQIKLMVSVKDGKVLKGNGTYPEIAPSVKYTESVSFLASTKNIFENVYFQLNDSQKHGWFKFHYRPYTSKGKLLEITEWSVNDSNGTWLLYPKSGRKQIMTSYDSYVSTKPHAARR